MNNQLIQMTHYLHFVSGCYVAQATYAARAPLFAFGKYAVHSLFSIAFT